MPLFSEMTQFLGGQTMQKPFVPALADLSGQTVIVTGANSGLGLDCAKHPVKLRVSRLIIASRNIKKGEAAREEVLRVHASCGKTIVESANHLGSHDKWVHDINEVSNTRLQFPIVADADRNVAWLYDMISESDLEKLAKEGGIAFTIRSVFIIDPAKKIRRTMMYPASTGRNTSEILRVIVALQIADKKGVTTPIDWTVGEDVIVPPSLSTEDARKKFGEDNVGEVKPYTRFTKV